MEKNKSKILIFAMILSAVILSAYFVVATQSVIDLGTAGNYVILAKSGISTTGTTSITGDIGVSPIDSTAITGFGLIMDSSNTFSTSSLITGNVYAADYTDPTPSILTTAVSDMETAYTDAAGRTLPDYTELYAGDLSGNTLVPGLYKWSTDVLINAGGSGDTQGITLSGSATDVWVFQIAQNLIVGNGAIITLSGGAQAENVFWQVGGGIGVTLGTTSDFSGNILAIAGIVVNTGATLDGRALAQTAVTLDANAVTSPTTAEASVLTTITLTPASANISVGSTQQLNATGIDQFDLPIAANISYNSNNLSVATVDNASGLVTAISSGDVIITASSGAVNSSMTITVSLAPVDPVPETTPETTSSSSSSSGGGGGFCSTQWICSAWSTCANGIQTRICSYPVGKWCTPSKAKPAESQVCTIAVLDAVLESDVAPIKVEGTTGITGGVINTGTTANKVGMGLLIGLIGLIAAAAVVFSIKLFAVKKI